MLRNDLDLEAWTHQHQHQHPLAASTCTDRTSTPAWSASRAAVLSVRRQAREKAGLGHS
ncbi:hypothetical protein BGZ61DRAFT_450294 [Ilyonectria robusta]|uniref:uncharacterized protein n=1 Tax=Ilyonectria robusta TaxID=1079257 RepID=UPI001E8CA4E6|nr:uncharacterized protein BGZ61DRAFT_450294 [Ilyonectria robusta]KAH8706671.1 hypothetical protein BGZ61DRAFT_450294 [Ilyonectria robusta]